ncbi:MAG: NlpC/P60 family protein [Chitinophagaceae bacterium]|nr:NlpC/P60 family protein [Chitinophagaceae bacterium]
MKKYNFTYTLYKGLIYKSLIFCIIVGINYSCTKKVIPSQGPCARILKQAKLHLNKGYCYGGVGPNCFDCSGLLNYVFKKNNIDIPRTTEELCKIKEIKQEKAQKCDIILFTGSDKHKRTCGHAGIITDIIDGIIYFIHAEGNPKHPHPSHKVKISNMKNRYYAARIIKIVRVSSE